MWTRDVSVQHLGHVQRHGPAHALNLIKLRQVDRYSQQKVNHPNLLLQSSMLSHTTCSCGSCHVKVALARFKYRTQTIFRPAIGTISVFPMFVTRRTSLYDKLAKRKSNSCQNNNNDELKRIIGRAPSFAVDPGQMPSCRTRLHP